MKQANLLATLTVLALFGCAVGSSADLGEATAPSPFDPVPVDAAARTAAEDAAPARPVDGASAADGGAKADGSAKVDGSGPVDGAPVVDAGPCSASGPLVSFDVTLLSGAQTSVAASSTTGGVTATALAIAGVSRVASSGALNASGWPAGGADAGKYFGFSVSPPVGCKLTASSLNIDLKSSSSGPASANIATSVDAFASSTGAPVTGSSVTVTLTGATDVTGALEIRIHGFGATSTSGTLRVEKTLTLNGSLAPM